MKLTSQELTGLRLALRDRGSAGELVLAQTSSMQVVSRQFTGPGFYTDLALSHAIEPMPELKLFQFNFAHSLLPFGGTFMCWLLSDITLLLEGVTFGGADWPRDFQFDESMLKD